MKTSDGKAVKSRPGMGVLRMMEYITAMVISLSVWLGIREFRVMFHDYLRYLSESQKKR